MLRQSTQKRRILVVDDHDDSRDLMSFILREHLVVTACNFQEGLRVANYGYFDLYILDNELPDGTGVDLCRRIREFDPYAPVIFCSGLGTEYYQREALRAGAQAYFVKPVSDEEIRMTVKTLLLSTRDDLYAARQAEFAAIQEAFAIRLRGNVDEAARATEKRRRAKQKVLRIRAERAFLLAGGTRGDFARLWPGVFEEAAAQVD
jgi:DNA-binding response OmpR family regulator